MLAQSPGRLVGVCGRLFRRDAASWTEFCQSHRDRASHAHRDCSTQSAGQTLGVGTPTQDASLSSSPLFLSPLRNGALDEESAVRGSVILDFHRTVCFVTTMSPVFAKVGVVGSPRRPRSFCRSFPRNPCVRCCPITHMGSAGNGLILAVQMAQGYVGPGKERSLGSSMTSLL